MKKILLCTLLLCSCQAVGAGVNLIGGFYHEYQSIERHDATTAQLEFMQADLTAIKNKLDGKQDTIPFNKTATGGAIATGIAGAWVWREKLKKLFGKINLGKVKELFSNLSNIKWRR